MILWQFNRKVVTSSVDNPVISFAISLSGCNVSRGDGDGELGGWGWSAVVIEFTGDGDEVCRSMVSINVFNSLLHLFFAVDKFEAICSSE
jgi:hypothetical protein